MHVAGLAYGSAEDIQWSVKERSIDFFDVKGDIEALFAPREVRFVPDQHPALHPGRSARVEVDGLVVGVVGELHPRWRQSYELPEAPIVFELEADALQKREIPVFQPIPRQQSAWRDIAVIVSEHVTHDALIDAVKSAHAGLIRSVRLFDVYKPGAGTTDMAPGERSLAIRLEVLDETATLTDERIESVKADALNALQSRLGVRLRG